MRFRFKAIIVDLAKWRDLLICRFIANEPLGPFFCYYRCAILSTVFLVAGRKALFNVIFGIFYKSVPDWCRCISEKCTLKVSNCWWSLKTTILILFAIVLCWFQLKSKQLNQSQLINMRRCAVQSGMFIHRANLVRFNQRSFLESLNRIHNSCRFCLHICFLHFSSEMHNSNKKWFEEIKLNWWAYKTDERKNTNIVGITKNCRSDEPLFFLPNELLRYVVFTLIFIFFIAAQCSWISLFSLTYILMQAKWQRRSNASMCMARALGAHTRCQPKDTHPMIVHTTDVKTIKVIFRKRRSRHWILRSFFRHICRVLGLKRNEKKMRIICDARFQMRVHDIPYRRFKVRTNITPHKCENINRLENQHKNEQNKNKKIIIKHTGIICTSRARSPVNFESAELWKKKTGELESRAHNATFRNKQKSSFK